LIRQSQALFEKHGQNVDGFEVWHGRRFVHRAASRKQARSRPPCT
jgi:hypothetical protein